MLTPLSSPGAAAQCAEDERGLFRNFYSLGPTPATCRVQHPRVPLRPTPHPPEGSLFGKDAA